MLIRLFILLKLKSRVSFLCLKTNDKQLFKNNVRKLLEIHIKTDRILSGVQ